MIESGTHRPGITAEMFGLPPGAAHRCEQPSPALRDHLPGYVVHHPAPASSREASEWMLPGCAQIRIVTRPASGERRQRHEALLCGVTSRAGPIGTPGSVTIAIDVSPLGWARLFRHSADAMCDRVAPLEEVMARDVVDELLALVDASDHGRGVKPLLDGFFARHLGPPNPDEPTVERIMATLAERRIGDLAEAAEAIGMSPKVMRRLTRRYFGFPPKTLTRRVRFLRALERMLEDADASPEAVPAGYHDASHFIRDAKAHLGMTARQFLAQEMPYLRAALRARRLVLEAGVPVLHARDAARPDQRSAAMPITMPHSNIEAAPVSSIPVPGGSARSSL